ncbi:hypothetical protein RVQ64_18605, partial [Enterobacter roggenkampii]
MVYENELWHSFLLRSQIMYNLSNCRNIISKHGALRYDAFPRFELIDMYKLHSLQDIYDILATRNGGNDSNLLIVFYVQIMPDDFVMQLHR